MDAGDLAIEPDHLLSFAFSEQDAVFLTDEAQFEYLCTNTNSSFARCLLLPLSLHAYAAAVHSHSRVHSYFEHIDFAECRRQYDGHAERLSRNWLKQLGLECIVQGIDLGEFDAPNQFHLFNLAAYLERTAGNLLRTLSEVENFYVLSGKDPLALEFYFDSDVPAALLRFICERADRRVRQIEWPRRTWILPSRRPFTCPSEGEETLKALRFSDQGGKRVGFAPAKVTGYQQILGALDALGSQTLIFNSAWGIPQIISNSSHFEYNLTDTQTPDSLKWDAPLREVWDAVKARRHRSILPPSLICNPHLDFQFAYILTRRWSSYVSMIYRAIDFVHRLPLDLFIHSETFTAEGVILAELYRRTGTPILVAPHSKWPCDRNWTTCKRSDVALVFSKSAAKRLKRIAEVSRVHVTPTPAPNSFRSLLKSKPAANIIGRKKEIAGGRKVVLIVTNALEILTVPFVDLSVHFGAISAIARPPEFLRDRVVLAIRAKPRPLGEDPFLYRSICEIPEEALAIVDGLTFSQCLDLADVVVGVNIPTSGYFEVMERGIPLVHIQTTDPLMLHPELPASVTASVRSVEAIWPTIERVLFDARHRRGLLERQRKYLEIDRVSKRSAASHSIERILFSMTDKAGWRFWQRPKKPARVIETIDLEHARFNYDAHAGYVDDLLWVSDNTAAVVGWAAEFAAGKPAKAVHVFASQKFLGTGTPRLGRPDVVEFFGLESLRNSGFMVSIPFENQQVPGSLRAYAELSDGSLAQLMLPENQQTQ